MVLAACHALMNDNGDLVGDPLEKAAFDATGWLMLGGDNASRFEGSLGSVPNVRIQHVHKHHFSSELKRMSVVAKVKRQGQESFWVLAKGAPEVMQQLMPDCPAHFEREHRRFASHGARMIALAAKKLDGEQATAEGARAMSRAEVWCSPAPTTVALTRRSN